MSSESRRFYIEPDTVDVLKVHAMSTRVHLLSYPTLEEYLE